MIPLLLIASGLTLTGLITGQAWAFAVGTAALLLAYITALSRNRRT